MRGLLSLLRRLKQCAYAHLVLLRGLAQCLLALRSPLSKGSNTLIKPRLLRRLAGQVCPARQKLLCPAKLRARLASLLGCPQHQLLCRSKVGLPRSKRQLLGVSETLARSTQVAHSGPCDIRQVAYCGSRLGGQVIRLLCCSELASSVCATQYVRCLAQRSGTCCSALLRVLQIGLIGSNSSLTGSQCVDLGLVKPLDLVVRRKVTALQCICVSSVGKRFCRTHLGYFCLLDVRRFPDYLLLDFCCHGLAPF